MFKKFELPMTPERESSKIITFDDETVKKLKSVTPIEFDGKSGREGNTSKVLEKKTPIDPTHKITERSQELDRSVNSSRQESAKDMTVKRSIIPKKPTKIGEQTPGTTLAFQSKWKVARKARVFGRMAIQKKEILSKNYGIDESTADKTETEEKIRCILPDNIYIIYWHRFIRILTLYLGFVYIFRVCLLGYKYDALFYIEIVMQSCFSIDVILNFFLAYHERDDLVTDLKSIVIHYLLTFFVFDLIAAFPVNLIAYSIDFKPGDESHRILRLLTTARILKFLIRIATYEGWKDIPYFAKRSPTIIRLIKILVLLGYFVHFSACIFCFAC